MITREEMQARVERELERYEALQMKPRKNPDNWGRMTSGRVHLPMRKPRMDRTLKVRCEE